MHQFISYASSPIDLTGWRADSLRSIAAIHHFLIHCIDASNIMASFAASVIGIVSAGTKVALVLS
jgi:hypothetical protein